MFFYILKAYLNVNLIFLLFIYINLENRKILYKKNYKTILENIRKNSRKFIII